MNSLMIKYFFYILPIFLILMACSRKWNNPFDLEIEELVPTDGLVAYYPFNGNANVRIYNRPLTDHEVQLLYHEGGWDN